MDKKMNDLILKETKAHNDLISAESKIEELVETIEGHERSYESLYKEMTKYRIDFNAKADKDDEWRASCLYQSQPCPKSNKIAIENYVKENEKLKIGMIKHTSQNYAEWRKEQETLAIGLVRADLDQAEEKIKKLKEENEELTLIIGDWENGNATLKDEIEKLKEENEKLKNATNISDYYMVGVLERISPLIPEEWMKDDGMSCEPIETIVEYIEELKKDIEKLKVEKD